MMVMTTQKQIYDTKEVNVFFLYMKQFFAAARWIWMYFLSQNNYTSITVDIEHSNLILLPL